MAKCMICGKEYKRVSWKHLWYEHSLTVAQYREQGGKTGSEKVCEICKADFIPGTRKQQFCSMGCAGIHRSRTQRGENNPNWGKHFKHTEETKEKIRKNSPRYWLGKKRPNVGAKISARLKGRSNLALKGRKFPGRNNVGQYPDGRVPWNKGKKMTPEYCENVRRTTPIRYGADNPAWKGGITPYNIKLRQTKQYAEWRIAVFERDKYTCQICGQVGRQLIGHHIRRFADYHYLRFDVDNGITLCRSCHSSLHSNPNNPHRERLLIKAVPGKQLDLF